MSKNNPVGNIPKKHPMLSRILQAAMDVYRGMDDKEVIELQKEIQSVTETNCSYKIYDIAKMMRHEVDNYCEEYLKN